MKKGMRKYTTSNRYNRSIASKAVNMIGGKLPKYAYGDQGFAGQGGYGQYGQYANALSGFGNTMSTNLQGQQNEWAAGLSGGIQGAGIGASIGSSIMPGVGTAIGAGVGFLADGISSYFGAEKKNENIKQQMDLQKQQQDNYNAQIVKQKKDYENMQRMSYSKSYLNAFPTTGQEGVGLYGLGGKLPKYTTGGNLTPISSNVQQVNGKSHAEGGVKLKSGGQPIAEVEGGETIVNNDSVASDRLKLPNGNTIAEETEKIGKKIAKAEKGLKYSTNTFGTNTSNRNLQNLNNQLQGVLAYQEQIKQDKGLVTGKMAYGGKLPKYGTGIDGGLNWDELTPTGIDSKNEFNETGKSDYYTGVEDKISDKSNPNLDDKNSWYSGLSKNLGNVASNLTPYLDNILNYNLISKTPQIPVPKPYETYNLTPATLKTNFNVQPALNAISGQYRSLSKNLDQNTSNSNISRANKLYAFSNLINKTSDVYGTKENTETQLKNQDSLNRQQVGAMNLQNQQQVSNANIDKSNQYAWNKMQRADDIRRQLSINMKETVQDATKQIQDKNLGNLDNEKMLLSTIENHDAAGAARLLGTDTMEKIVSTDEGYRKIEALLHDRKADLARFYQLHGKR